MTKSINLTPPAVTVSRDAFDDVYNMSRANVMLSASCYPVGEISALISAREKSLIMWKARYEELPYCPSEENFLRWPCIYRYLVKSLKEDPDQFGASEMSLAVELLDAYLRDTGLINLDHKASGNNELIAYRKYAFPSPGYSDRTVPLDSFDYIVKVVECNAVLRTDSYNELEKAKALDARYRSYGLWKANFTSIPCPVPDERVYTWYLAYNRLSGSLADFPDQAYAKELKIAVELLRVNLQDTGLINSPRTGPRQ